MELLTLKKFNCTFITQKYRHACVGQHRKHKEGDYNITDMEGSRLHAKEENMRYLPQRLTANQTAIQFIAAKHACN